MKKKIILLICFLLFFNGFFSQCCSNSEPIISKASYHEWYVDQSNSLGPWDGSFTHPFQYISDAISTANPYDIVFVSDGSYSEHLTISIPLSLIGVSNTVLDGTYNKTILTVKTQDVLIKNLIIEHSGGFSNDSGMRLTSSSNISIINCTYHHTRNGISIEDSSIIVLEQCNFFHNGNGINIHKASSVKIEGCDFAHNSIALVGVNSLMIVTTGVTFQGNGLSGVFHQVSSIQVENCNLSDNSVNKGGFVFTNVSHASIYNCLFNHNGDAISISNCHNFTIDQCSFTYNTHFAISMRQPSENIQIFSSNISNNLRTAIYMETGNRVKINDSNIVGNYLYSILAEPLSYYDAFNNYWGTSLGPLHYEMLVTNKIKQLQGLARCIPWSSRPIQSIGVIFTKIPVPRSNYSFDEVLSYICQENDTDKDGAPDWWENKWGYNPNEWENHSNLDPDMDALTNLQEYYTDVYGSNPFFKDVFLEIDWMICPDQDINKPNEILLRLVVDAFANQNISLHIDLGNLGGGDSIPDNCDHRVVYTALESLYWQYFLHNDLANPRKGIFHYGIICNYCPDLNFPFMGWDTFDSFAISAEWLEQEFPRYNREQLIVGGIMHHLGHTLGLIADVYLGIDNVDTIYPLSFQWFNYRNYNSSMNYLYKFTVFTYSDGANGKGDFNDWRHLRFNFFKQSIFSA